MKRLILPAVVLILILLVVVSSVLADGDQQITLADLASCTEDINLITAFANVRSGEPSTRFGSVVGWLRYDNETGYFAMDTQIYGNKTYLTLSIVDVVLGGDTSFGPYWFQIELLDSQGRNPLPGEEYPLFINAGLTTCSDEITDITDPGEYDMVYGENEQAVACFTAFTQEVSEFLVRPAPATAGVLEYIFWDNSFTYLFAIEDVPFTETQVVIEVFDIYHNEEQYYDAIDDRPSEGAGNTWVEVAVYDLNGNNLLEEYETGFVAVPPSEIGDICI